MAFATWLDAEAGMLPAGQGQAGFVAHSPPIQQPNNVMCVVADSHKSV